MREKSPRCMIMQNRYDNGNAWDKVLAKLDHLTDPGPSVLMVQRKCDRPWNASPLSCWFQHNVSRGISMGDCCLLVLCSLLTFHTLSQLCFDISTSATPLSTPSAPPSNQRNFTSVVLLLVESTYLTQLFILQCMQTVGKWEKMHSNSTLHKLALCLLEIGI